LFSLCAPFTALSRRAHSPHALRSATSWYSEPARRRHRAVTADETFLGGADEVVSGIQPAGVATAGVEPVRSRACGGQGCATTALVDGSERGTDDQLGARATPP